jgi:hypothetical protein
VLTHTSAVAWWGIHTTTIAMNNTMVAKIIIVVVDGHDEYMSILIRLSSSYLFSIFGIFGLYLPEYYSFLKKLLLSLCSRII